MEVPKFNGSINQRHRYGNFDSHDQGPAYENGNRNGQFAANASQWRREKSKFSTSCFLSSTVIISLVFYNLWLTMRLATLEAGKYPPDATDAWTEVRVKKASVSVDDGPPTIDWNIRGKNIQLDIGVPVSGSDNKLAKFAKFLGSSIQQFNRQVKSSDYTFRLLITRYPQANASEALRQELLHTSAADFVVFVPMNQTQFHRAAAINALHSSACVLKDCVLAIVDVDLTVGHGFLRNALSIVGPKTIYFPIVWSEFRPSSVALVELFLGPLPKFHQHKGLWREFGYGMYAISGADVTALMMNNSFVGWGGEDNDFFSRAQGYGMTIVREHEHGLVHLWHPKVCENGTFVQEARYMSW